MRFDKDRLFNELVVDHGLNLFLGAGFSTHAYNSAGDNLPLGNEINKILIDTFQLDKDRDLSLSKTCQKIKKDNAGSLEKFLKDIYTVQNFDKEYLEITKLPLKNIMTINIDNLLEKIFASQESVKTLSDTAIYGGFEKENLVNLFKLHGSVTYPLGTEMLFTKKELTNLFLKNRKLFETVSYKMAIIPTIFWGVSLSDNDSIELLCNSEIYANSSIPKWILVYKDEKNEKLIEDFEDMGFQIIVSDTKELISYLANISFVKKSIYHDYSHKDYQKEFPSNFICDSLKRNCVRRPVIDFFAGAEPQISDIISNNVSRISYFSTILNVIFSGNITLITGIPGCGKSTLLMQLAFSDELKGNKFLFNNIIKTEAERLVKITEKDKSVIIFIDNLYNNIEALQVLMENGVKLVLAERALNFEYAKQFLNISSDSIIDISNLNPLDVQVICKSMNRTSNDAINLIKANSNISLLEIVFFVTTNSIIQDRIKQYIHDLSKFEDEKLKINLLELFTLVSYTGYCGIPCSMDMMYFYFSADKKIDSYKDIFYALEKMNQIIVETSETDDYGRSQGALVMRSKLFSEKTLKLIDSKMMAEVLKNFLTNVSSTIIYRYDVFKRKAYDADITKRVFNIKDGIIFYEDVLKVNQSPYIRQQYALFLQRNKKYDLAWNQIDQAYTESKRKIFSIANSHAIIMFEKNIDNKVCTEKEMELLKDTIRKSFATLEYCITQDVRVSYHVLTYSRNAVRYCRRFGKDEYAKEYIDSALQQIATIMDANEYIYSGIMRELKKLNNELIEIKNDNGIRDNSFIEINQGFEKL